MPDGRRGRRRRRGGANRPQGQGQPPPDAAPAPDTTEQQQARPGRVDHRRSSQDEQGRPPGPPGPGRIQRSPAAGETRPRGPSAGESRQRDGRGRDGRDGRGSREGRPQREQRPRVFEAPVPQDERSVELGAAFKESQVALRDARKALDKRRAEFDDEPEWMLAQLAEAEKRFEEAATAWSDHLATTGRKVVRR